MFFLKKPSLVTIQGNGCKDWAEVEFPQTLKSLNDFTNAGTTNRNTIQDAKPVDQLCEDEEGLIDIKRKGVLCNTRFENKSEV